MAQPVLYENHSASWSSGRGGWCGSSGESLNTLTTSGTPQSAYGTQPTTSASEYVFIEPGRYVIPPGAFFSPTGATAGDPADDALLNHPTLTIGEDAKGQIVFDLSQITAFAHAQYAGASSNPGGGLGGTPPPAWPAFPGLVDVGGTASQYLPSPVVTVANKGRYSGFVVVSTDATASSLASVNSKGAFQAVSSSNGVYSRERYDLQYNPVMRAWTVCNRGHA